MRLERWLHEWDVFIVIMLTGLLAGLVTFMAFDVHPAACRTAVSHLPGKTHLIWVCEHP